MKARTLAYGDKDYVRFVICGCFNTGLCFLLYSFGIVVGLNYMISNAISWIVGVTVSFLLNSRYVFRKSYRHKRLLLFTVSNILSLLISIIMLTLLIKGLLMNPIIAAAVTIPVVVALNFTASKVAVFSGED